MANSFAKKIDVFFDDVVAGFDATNISSKNVSQYKAPAEALALNGQTFHRPMPMMTEIVDGRDITGQYKDLVELTVPATLTESHIRNVPVKLTGVDLNNPYAFDNIVKTSNILLSNKLDTLVANRVAERGTLAVINTGAIDTYDDAAEADALMLEQQATRGERIMLLNPRMAKNIAGNLAGRQMMNTAPMNAYQRSTLQPIAGFDTFRVDYGKSITGSAGAGYLVDTAQAYTPVSADSNGIPADNRTQVLKVKTGTGAAVGDVFTIAGVYAVGHINKQSTGQLKTFRILAIDSGNWTISPAIVPADGAAVAQKAYANVTTGAAADAAITILNTKTTAASVFYEKSAIEIVHADFNTEPFEASGKRVRKATTDSGIQIVMLSDSNVDTLAANYRLFVWANVEVLNPELAGIMLENQT
ncbi:P22 phage major capsid protein family protein [Acinetobacter indicus]|uniref:P22 phage major capsid protein family protein n=1 Tax=Acinetobacter indicus TaxID=756892 RepID=UPI0032B5C96C